MKAILTTALALSLLGGTAVMAQPDTQLRISQNDNRDQQDNNRQDRRDRKAADKKAADQTSADKKAADVKAAQQKAADKTAADRRTNDRLPADQKVNDQRAKDQVDRGRRDVRQRASDKAVNDRRVNDQRNADQKAIEQRAVDQKSADQIRQDQIRRDQSRQDQIRQDQIRQDQTRQDQIRQEQIRNDARDAQDRRDSAAQRADRRRWSRGDRLPDQYRQDRYYVNDWQQYGLNRPPRGYRWVRDDNNDFFLAAIATGIISMVIYRDDRDQRWQRRYSRTYSYNDDIYYRECRNSPDPAGVIVGALIGGLLGHTASGGRTGATVAGVVVGGALGAALTSNLDCEDRSYAYKTYYDGFNAGRAYRNYSWRNPSNNHRGTFRVGRYYNDPDGFRCATFSQTAYIGSQRHRANGRACRQPDGTWAVVN